MEIFNVGPLELIIILLLMFIILGPKDMVKTAQSIGRWVRSITSSPMWREVWGISQDIRELPKKLMEETGLEEALTEVKQTTQEVANEFNAQINEVTEAARIPEIEHIRIENPLTTPPPDSVPAVVKPTLETTALAEGHAEQAPTVEQPPAAPLAESEQTEAGGEPPAVLEVAEAVSTEATPAQPKKSRRKKQAAPAEQAEAPVEQAEAPVEQAEAVEQAAVEPVVVEPAPSETSAPKKLRRKAARTQESDAGEEPAPAEAQLAGPAAGESLQPAEPADESPVEKKPRRKKPAPIVEVVEQPIETAPKVDLPPVDPPADNQPLSTNGSAAHTSQAEASSEVVQPARKRRAPRAAAQVSPIENAQSLISAVLPAAEPPAGNGTAHHEGAAGDTGGGDPSGEKNANGPVNGASARPRKSRKNTPSQPSAETKPEENIG